LLAELSRNRLVSRVDNLLDNFVLRASSDQELDLDMNKIKLATFLKLCYESRDLISQIESEKRQLTKMSAKTSKVCSMISQNNSNDKLLELPETRKCLRLAGQKISSRLEEILNEYDDKINDCNMVIENMLLTMQTAR
jgi:hypothetical protein